MIRPGLVAILLAGFLFAGCTSAGGGGSNTTFTKAPLAANTGGIQGLLIDDVYRPITKATLLLTPLGLTTTSDSHGEFEFRDLAPGTYGIQVSAAGHEAAPTVIDVSVGEYTELEVEARRIVSDDAYAITVQYSVFIPCAVASPAASTIHGYCFYDTSSESFRPGLEGLDFRKYNNKTAGFNITYLVTEMVVNQPDNYVLTAREDDGSSFGGDEFGRSYTEGGTYAKVVLQKGANYMQTANSATWNNTEKIEVIVFYTGVGGAQLTETVTPAYCSSGLPNVDNPDNGRPLIGCKEYAGAGHKMGIKANLLLTLFLGPPRTAIEEYGLLDGS